MAMTVQFISVSCSVAVDPQTGNDIRLVVAIDRDGVAWELQHNKSTNSKKWVALPVPTV